MSQNVFGYLYGVHLPKRTFDVLEEHIFEKPIIKTYQQLTYSLPRPDHDDADWVVMECEYEYKLKNISDKIVNHAVKFYCSEPTESSAPHNSDVGLKTLSIGNETIPSDEFPNLDKAAKDEPGFKRYVREVSIGPGDELPVRVVFKQQKRVLDNDLYQTGSVTGNFRLKFRYNPSEYAVFLEPVHPNGAWEVDTPASDGDHCRTVAMNTPLLPQNGAFMWWQPLFGPHKGRDTGVDKLEAQEE